MAPPGFDNVVSTDAYAECVCGHILYHHYNDSENTCYYGPRNQRPSELQCNCVGYKRDNLRYLENLLEKKENEKVNDTCVYYARPSDFRM